MMDNSNVVPHCPYLLLKFGCHINVEVTFGMHSIKYIHKYIYKGHERTPMEFGKHKDEIKQYLSACYVSAPEAFWRLTSNEIHSQHPAMFPLLVHLPDEQAIVFDPIRKAEDIEMF